MARPRILVNALSMSEGGGRSYITNLLRELAVDDRGLDFTLLARPGQLDGLDTSGVTVAPLRLPERGRTLWRVGYEELVLPLRARSHDLLYCVADIAPPWGRTPTVVLLRNLNIYDRRWYDDARTRTLERLARLGLPHSVRILFPSRAAADLISERIPVPADRVRVVPYGIALDTFERAAPPPDAGRYLFVAAAVEKHKNLEVLIRALPHVADEGLELWIAGHSLLDPGHQGVLERLASDLGVARRVRFLGAVPYREILGYYRGAVAFTFPSFIETFGHPLLEAMAVGTPLIAADIPTFREIAGSAALYFPVDDPEALARCVDAVQQDPGAAARRVERGSERVEEFSWKRSVDALCEVFWEVLGGRGGAVPTPP